MANVALAASVTHALVAVAHTVHGLNTFSLPPYQSLSPLLRCYAKAGWYQGSAFFTLFALWTYQLSQRNPVTWTRIDRILLGGLAAIYSGSSAWYFKHGDTATAGVTGFGGLITVLVLMQ